MLSFPLFIKMDKGYPSALQIVVHVHSPIVPVKLVLDHTSSRIRVGTVIFPKPMEFETIK